MVSSRPQQKPHQSLPRPLSAKRQIRRVLAALILLPLVVYGLYAVASSLQHARQTSAAKAKVTTARQVALKTADATFSDQVQLLEQQGLVGASIATSKVDVCYVTHNDASLSSIANWYQDCYLRYLGGFTTAASKDLILQKIAGMQSTFGEPQINADIQRAFPCEVAARDYRETVRFRRAGTPIAAKDGADSDGCDVPNQLQGTFSVNGPLLLDEELAVKKFQSFDPRRIDNNQNQLWNIYENHYYHEELGCSISPFCDSPRSKPVQAP